ncbi:hypothetical protein WG947_07865 [Pontibacter sp. H259]|uniref:hypothetical protein n=1 Tax=Pontibacter sp. H259 TaxID=3133421 RepID=UPI0030BA937D
MKVTQLLLLTGISMAVLTSCDKDIAPTPTLPPVTKPTPGNGQTPPPATPIPTTPPVTTPPVTTPPAPVTANSLLTQMGSRKFTYDAQKRLVEVDFLQQPYLGFTIVYEGNRPVRINKDTGGWMTYTYVGDKVSEVHSYYGEGLVNYWYKFEYEGNLLVKKTTLSFARSAIGQLGVNTYKYDANGNLLEIAVRWSTDNQEANLSNPSIITWGNYNNLPNPMPYVEDGIYLPGIKLFKTSPGYRDTGGGKEFYSYLAHDSGMPQKRYTTLEAYPHVPATGEEYTYQP